MIVSRGKLLGYASLTVMAMMGIGAPVLAAEADASASASPATLDELTVTARRRVENIQTVPIAVTRFGGEQLRAKSIVQLDDLQRHTPSLTIQPGLGGSTTAVINLRGQVQNDSLITLDPSVGVYQDGVYLGRSSGVLSDMFDVERVEVLKGPQGTLYGRNTTGGAIKLESRQADPAGEVSGYLQAGIGKFKQRDFEGAINLPVVKDKLALRVAAVSHVHDGYSTTVMTTPLGVPTGEAIDTDDKNFKSYRANAVFTPNDKAKITLQLDGARERSNGQLSVNRPGDVLDLEDFTFSRSSDDFHTGTSDVTPYSTLNAWGLSGKGEYDFGSVVATLILAHRDLRATQQWNVDGIGAGLLGVPQTLDQNQETGELQFAGKAFNDRLDWLVGLYYFEETGFDFTQGNFFFGQLTTTNPGDAKNTSKSAYTHLNYKLTDSLSITAGVRYTWDKKRLHGENRANGFCGYLPGTPGVVINSPTDCYIDVTDKFDYPAWTVGLDYRLNEDVMVYVKGNSSSRSGGQNIRGAGLDPLAPQFGNTAAPFEKETATDIEIGFKSELLDRRLRLNADYFHTFYKDIQQAIIIYLPSLGGTTNQIINTGDGNVDGVEVEATAVISENLTWDVGASYIKAKLDDPQFVAPKTPKVRFSTTLNFNLPVSYGKWNASVSYTYQDKNYMVSNVSVPASANISPSYGLLNARLGLYIEKYDFDVTAWGKNLTNKNYYHNGTVIDLTGAGISPPLQPINVGAPRTFGVEVRKTF